MNRLEREKKKGLATSKPVRYAKCLLRKTFPNETGDPPRQERKKSV